jgi:SAM-dependent methyltransferase
MPDCTKCERLNTEGPKPSCSLNHERSPTRACVMAMLLKHLPDMEGQVLEVGYGVWRYPRKLIRSRRREGKEICWYGIDPCHSTVASQRRVQATAEDMPFEDGAFDWVLSFSSIEHWTEFGETVRGGVKQIHRVLKPGGRMLVSAPMFYHGSDLFVYGMVDGLVSAVNCVPWTKVDYEEWRRDPKPLDRFDARGNPGRILKGQRLRDWQRQDQTLHEMCGDTIPSAWTLEILAVK